MDFLKSLMIYMSVLFMMGVENAEMPDPATIPTPTPTVAVTAEPETTAAVKATKTPRAATPVPALTPNNRYATLRSGDKGNNVKKLQQRLIALGYMKKGTADGKYGGQTVAAVKAFQKANGLAADGVAGKMTLTYLYEYKQVVAAATATPAPKSTATPRAASKATATAKSKGSQATTAPKSKATAAPKATEIPTPAQDGAALKASWYRTGAAVLLNQTPVMVLQHEEGMTTSRGPAVYMHDGMVIVSLTELSKAAAWQLDSQADGNGFTLKASGYTLIVSASNGGYTAQADGKDVEVGADMVYFADGEWLVNTTFLKNSIGAVSTWDQEENTLVIRVTEKSLAESDD